MNNNEKFAEYVIETLVKRFKIRDYTSAIEVKDYAFPVLWDLQRMLKEKSKTILENSVDEIKATLEEYEGTVEEVEAEEKAFNVELISQLDEITANRVYENSLEVQNCLKDIVPNHHFI